MTRTLIFLKYEFLSERRGPGTAVRLTFGPLLFLLCGFALHGRTVSSLALALVYWTVLAASALIAPLHLFSREIDEGTLHFSGQFFSPVEIFSAKMLFSLTLSTLSAILCPVLFTVFIRETGFLQLLLLTLSAQMPLCMLFMLPSFFSAILKGGYALAAFTGLPFLFPVFSIAVEQTVQVLDGVPARGRSFVFFFSLSVFVALVSAFLAHPVWRSYENT